MVSINGIQLKNVKTQKDGGFSSSIYMDGKRIGETAEGTGINFEIKPQFKPEFEKRIQNVESFVKQYFDLIMIEKKYTEAAKKYSKQQIIMVAAYKKEDYAGRIYTALEKFIPEIIKTEKSNKCQVKIFRNLSDFNF